MKVVVAEDSTSMLKIVVRMLNTLGYKDVEEFSNGLKAWEYIRSNKTDLLLTDCNMPIMSGRELAQKVRGKHSSGELPILMFTTLNTKRDLLASVKAGVNGYIIKPFTPPQLKVQLDKILSKHDGASLQEWAKKIEENNQKPDIQETFPLVFLGEKVSTPRELSQLKNKDCTRFLASVVEVIGESNQEFPDLQLGYFVAHNPDGLVRQIRLHRQRLKLLLLSTEIEGGGVTLARLARINQTAPLTVGLVAYSLGEIDKRAREGLQKAGVLLLERQQLDKVFLKRLFREQVVAQEHQVPAEELTPEQIFERIESDIGLMTSLPILPVVYHRIVRLARYRDSDIQDWIEAIKTDPLSSAMIIRRANSPFYGFKTKVNDIDKAVTLLGKDTVKELIVEDALKRSFENTQEKSFNLEDYWLHSLATALIARILNFPLDRSQWEPEQVKEFEGFNLSENAVSTLQSFRLDEKLSLASDEDPFVGGMMHDLGKAALAHCYPGLFPAIIEEMEKAEWKAPMITAEEAVSGITHAQVGQILAKNWSLDEGLLRVIAQHHTPAGDDRFTQLIGLANFLAGAIYPYPGDAQSPLVRAVQQKTVQGGESMTFDADDEEQVKAVDAFLPKELPEQLGLELDKLLQLGFVLYQDVRNLVEKFRASMKE